MADSAISGSMAMQAQAGLMQARENNLLRQVHGAQAGQQDGSIEKAARDFESMLLNNWLQQAEQSMASVPGGDDDEDSSGKDQMMSLGVQSLATSLASSGGIGIASMIAKALHSAADRSNPAGSPAAAAEAKQIER